MTSKKQRKVPELRFRGFTDDWEQRKLAETASEFIGGGTPSTSVNEFWTGEIPWIQSSNLAENVVDRVAIDKKISENAILKTAAKKISSNSIAVVTRVGVGKLAFIPFEYATSQDFLSFSKLKVSPWFLVYLLSEKLAKWGNETQGTSIKGITKKELLSKKVLMPSDSMEEQAVGELLKKLDSTIALHQRKQNLLEKLKQGYLQKLFPQKGQRQPELRFPGFTDDWEQRKLGTVSSIRTGPFGSTLHAEDYVEEGIPIVTTEHFKNGSLPIKPFGLPQVSSEDYQRLKSYKLQSGDIVFSRVGSIDINAEVLKFQEGWLFSGRVLRVRPNKQIQSTYLHYVLSTGAVKQTIRSRAVGQTMPSINTQILKNTRIVISPIFEEQDQIARLLETVDNTIALHQQEIDRLQQLKQGYLQKMFV